MLHSRALMARTDCAACLVRPFHRLGVVSRANADHVQGTLAVACRVTQTVSACGTLRLRFYSTNLSRAGLSDKQQSYERKFFDPNEKTGLQSFLLFHLS